MSSLISVTKVGSNTESLQCGSLCGCVCDRMADIGEKNDGCSKFLLQKSLKMHLRGSDRSVQMEALEFWVYEAAFQQC